MRVPYTRNPLTFLRAAMADENAPLRLRVAAAKGLLPFVHARGGLKAERQARARRGRFASQRAPVIRMMDYTKEEK